MSPEEREQRIRALPERWAERLAEQWPDAGSDINDLEDFAQRLGREVQREISDEISDETLTEVAVRKDGSQSACPCGGTATYQRHRALTLVTAAGRSGSTTTAAVAAAATVPPMLAYDSDRRIPPLVPRPGSRCSLRCSPGALWADTGVGPLRAARRVAGNRHQERGTAGPGGGHRLGAVTLRPHGPATRPVAVVCDGAALDWVDRDRHLPQRVEILDLYQRDGARG